MSAANRSNRKDLNISLSNAISFVIALVVISLFIAMAIYRHKQDTAENMESTETKGAKRQNPLVLIPIKSILGN